MPITDSDRKKIKDFEKNRNPFLTAGRRSIACSTMRKGILEIKRALEYDGHPSFSPALFYISPYRRFFDRVEI